MRATANQVAEWIKGFKSVKDVQPVAVTIGKVTYEGARYQGVHKYQEGMRIVQDGTVQAGDEYTQEAIILLGARPRHRKVGTCYPLEGQEWYVASYYNGPDKNEYHPFGACFTLMPWTADEKIDHYERFAYDRIPITVTSATA